MNDFKQYIISEYKDKITNYAACDFKFVHTTNIKTDKKSNKTIVINIIKTNFKFIDNECNTMLSDTLTFENNLLNKSCSKKLKHISDKELNNKFAFAKSEIINAIMNEYQNKANEIKQKIDSLIFYKSSVKGIIPNEFKGECIMFAGDSVAKEDESIIHKNRFDM